MNDKEIANLAIQAFKAEEKHGRIWCTLRSVLADKTMDEARRIWDEHVQCRAEKYYQSLPKAEEKLPNYNIRWRQNINRRKHEFVKCACDYTPAHAGPPQKKGLRKSAFYALADEGYNQPEFDEFYTELCRWVSRHEFNEYKLPSLLMAAAKAMRDDE